MIKAKDEIGSLESEGKQMEVEKVDLLEKRKTLFDTFTRSLQGRVFLLALNLDKGNFYLFVTASGIFFNPKTVQQHLSLLYY